MNARSIALIATLAAAAPLAAQQPFGGPPGPEMAGQGPMAGAFLLAHTGDLQLTDQQVTRLAAIARREGARRRALRSTLDSLRSTAPERRDSAARARIAPQFGNTFTQMRDQSRADLRDAITVLTPAQQAQAWQMISARGGRGGARMAPPGMRPRMDRGGRGGRPS